MMRTMNRTTILVIVLCAVAGVGLAAYYFSVSESSDAVPASNQTYEQLQTGTPLGGGVLGGDVESAVVIRRTNEGYEPNEVTIQEGDTVTFVNESSEFHWPASDVHPTHTIYSDFDPREPVAPGDSWSFMFTQTGEWVFHDHLRANLKGVVTVEPQ